MTRAHCGAMAIDSPRAATQRATVLAAGRPLLVSAAAAEPTQHVLLLYSNDRLLSANLAMDTTLRAALPASAEVDAEFLGAPRFSGAAVDRLCPGMGPLADNRVDRYNSCSNTISTRREAYSSLLLGAPWQRPGRHRGAAVPQSEARPCARLAARRLSGRPKGIRHPFSRKGD